MRNSMEMQSEPTESDNRALLNASNQAADPDYYAPIRNEFSLSPAKDIDFLAAAGLSPDYMIPASSRIGSGAISNASFDPSSGGFFQLAASNDLAKKFGFLDEGGIYSTLDKLTAEVIKNGPGMATLRANRLEYENLPWYDRPAEIITSTSRGIVDTINGTVTGTIGGLQGLGNKSSEIGIETLAFFGSIAGKLIRNDIQGAQNSISERLDSAYAKGEAITGSLKTMSDIGSLLMDKRAADNLGRIGQAYWSEAATPDKAYAVSMFVGNVLLAGATGGESAGAQLASKAMLWGSVGAMLETSTLSAARRATLRANELVPAFFRLVEEAGAMKIFSDVAAKAMVNGTTQAEIAALQSTRVFASVANASPRERAGVLSAIIRAENQGMKFMDVVLQNNSGHGVDLMFRTKSGKLAIVEAKAGARLSDLNKVNGPMRQGGNDFNRTRLEKFVNNFKNDPNRANDVAAAKLALVEARNLTLESYASLGRSDKFFKLNFDGQASVAQMNAIPLSWQKRPIPI